MIPKIEVTELLDGLNDLRDMALKIMSNPKAPLPEDMQKLIAYAILLGDNVNRHDILKGMTLCSEGMGKATTNENGAG